MKSIFYLSLAVLATNVASSAQIFRPQAMNGAVSHRHAQVHSRDGGRESHRGHQTAHVGRGHGGRYHDFHHGHAPYRHYDRHHHGHAGFGYFGSPFRYSTFPRYSYVPSYGYYSGYGHGYPYYDYGYGYHGSRTAATNGLLLGALAGGIIGHNSGDLHHSAWRGSAWGAGLGWLLGSAVDANRRAVVAQPAVVVAQPAYQAQAQPGYQVQAQAAAPAQPQQVTIINNYYNSSTPMSGVNGMFGR